ncbi:RICIN domain-containing protein [Catellatospora sp. NPDC049111]|uniref:RICIN domain-containing protein n=1 Tax=Catellatospora sp. NPDC049111 TaxID=3155271 RepID=UPI0033E679B0
MRRVAARAILLTIALIAPLVTIGAPAQAGVDISGVFRLRNEVGWGCMYVQGTANNQPVYKWDLCEDNVFADQYWEFVPLGNGYHQIRNRNSDKCLRMPNNSLNTNATQYTCSTADTSSIPWSQQWEAIEEGDWGDIMLKNRSSGKCLISQSGTTAVVQYTCLPQYHDQLWFYLDS